MIAIGRIPLPDVRLRTADRLQLHADGSVSVVNLDGSVMSVQPDGTVETRPTGTYGPYERANRLGPDVLIYWSGVGENVYAFVLVESLR